MALGAQFGNLEKGMFGRKGRAPSADLAQGTCTGLATAPLRSTSSFSKTQFFEQHPMLKWLVNLVSGNAVTRGRIALYKFASEQIDERLASGGNRADMVSAINKAKEPLSREELNSNMMVLLAAGSETTASALTGLIYYLHLPKNVAVLRKLKDEIGGRYQSGDEVSGDNSAELPYVKACIQEILRLYPPIPSGWTRRTNQETMISGHIVPANVSPDDGIFVPANATNNIC